MKSIARRYLIFSGVATTIAALLHVAIAIGGPSWYAFFGAPARLVEAARLGDPRAPITCIVIACILALFAAYAFSGAGVIRRLPLLRPVLTVVAAIFLLRGITFIPIALSAPSALARLCDCHGVDAFMLVSSLVCLAIGLGYAAGAREA